MRKTNVYTTEEMCELLIDTHGEQYEKMFLEELVSYVEDNDIKRATVKFIRNTEKQFDVLGKTYALGLEKQFTNFHLGCIEFEW